MLTMRRRQNACAAVANNGSAQSTRGDDDVAIKKAPLKTDTAGKCSRWRVILYNPATHKQEWHTVNGTRRDAQAFERQQKTRQASGVYIAKAERRTFAEVAELFLKERTARARRAGTIACYESLLNLH